MVRIAGLDLSLNKSGVARPNGTFETVTPRGAGYERHWSVTERISDVLNEYSVDVVIIEDYAPHGPGINALITSAEIGGMVRAMLTRRRVPFALVRPSTLKLVATGKGNAKKALVFDAARAAVRARNEATPSLEARVDREPANYDEADAYWLRRIGRYHYDRLAGFNDELEARLAHADTIIEWPELDT